MINTDIAFRRQARQRGSGVHLLLVGSESVDNHGSLLLSVALRRFVAEHGRGSIVSSIGGNVSLVRSGKEGHVFDLDEESAQTNCRMRLLASAAQIAALLDAAPRRAESQYSLTATARAHVRTYDDLLSP